MTIVLFSALLREKGRNRKSSTVGHLELVDEGFVQVCELVAANL
ncbi:hypothetical protein [Coleofasciculus sp. E1-EBD-02]